MSPTEIIFEVTEAIEGGYDARATGCYKTEMLNRRVSHNQ